jgi:glycosyltransferase involved in cell wall biosynthesis
MMNHVPFDVLLDDDIVADKLRDYDALVIPRGDTLTKSAHERIVAFAAEHNVADRLHLVGEVPYERIYEFLQAGDVFAFPSMTETFGLAVVEAAIAGLPIVANDLPVLHEVLSSPDKEPAAIFTASNDADGFAKGLAEIAGNADLAARLSAAGRKLAMKYSPEIMCERYEKLLA